MSTAPPHAAQPPGWSSSARWPWGARAPPTLLLRDPKNAREAVRHFGKAPLNRVFWNNPYPCWWKLLISCGFQNDCIRCQMENSNHSKPVQGTMETKEN